MTTALQADLRRLAALGHTAREAADLAGCTARTARMIASRHGFRFPHESEHRARRAVDLARAGRTAGEIAAELGIHRGSVSRLLARIPDAPRPPTQAQAARAAQEKAAAAQEAERMERWRASWAARKAVETPGPRGITEEDLGDAMRRLALRERERGTRHD